MGTMGAIDQYSSYVELLQILVDCPEFADEYTPAVTANNFIHTLIPLFLHTTISPFFTSLHYSTLFPH